MSSELARAIKALQSLISVMILLRSQLSRGYLALIISCNFFFLSSSLNEGSRLGGLITASIFVNRTQAVSLKQTSFFGGEGVLVFFFFNINLFILIGG